MSPFQVTPEWEETSSDANLHQSVSDSNDDGSNPISNEAPPSTPTTQAPPSTTTPTTKAPPSSKTVDNEKEKPATTPLGGEEEDKSLNDMIRKAGVAVAGGAMVGIGLVMIPLPTPCGALVAGSGLAVLGTEFEGARKIMDHTVDKIDETRVKLVETIERNVDKKDDNDEEEEKAGKDKTRTATDASNNNTSPEEKKEPERTPPRMNEAERLRQKKLQEQRDRFKGMYGVEQETIQETIDQTRRVFKKQTRELGRTILPFLKKIDVHELRKEHLPNAKTTATQTATTNTKEKEIVSV